MKEMEWINSWLVGWQRVYFSPSLLSHSVCDQVLFLVAVGAICAQGATINTLRRQKRTLGVLSTAAGIIFIKWSAFISIQWRRLFYLSFDSKQFVSNYKFTSKQREALNWQLLNSLRAAYRSFSIFLLVEIKILIENRLHCIYIYEDDCNKIL